MIIAVDYDGTLKIDKQMNMPLISKLKRRQAMGDIVILWTCRSGSSLQEAIGDLAGTGFRPNLINDNAPAIIKKLGHNPRKVFADIYIDDKNLR